MKLYEQRYRHSKKGKAAQARAMAKYFSTEKGKAALARAQEKFKAAKLAAKKAAEPNPE